MISKWRYVKYTDDGSAEYQCLNCYNSWDARTAPGWFNTVEDIDEPCEGSMTVTDANGQRHFKTREVPEYKLTWTFCPYCGIKWEGPVRCDIDNEYMYGPKRLAVWKNIQERQRRDGWRQPEYTGLWWVIVERSIWRSNTAQVGNTSVWESKEYAKVHMMPAVKMLYLLRDYQAMLDAEYNSDPNRYCDYEAKIIVTYVQPNGGYEIHNYEVEK